MIFKYLIPFDRFVIQSRMSPAEVRHALAAIIEAEKAFRLTWMYDTGFEGRIDYDRFKIHRIAQRFPTMVIGGIEAGPAGSVLHVYMRPGGITAVFFTIWFLTGIQVTSRALWDLISGDTPISPIWALLPLALIGVFCLLVNLPFWMEANRQKKMLLGILEGMAG